MIPPGYLVMADGRIQGRSGKWLKYRKHPAYGYRMFNANVNGKHTTFAVHRVICEAFNGPKPTPEHEVLHIDGDTGHNAAHNLRWGLPVENSADRVKHGTQYQGDRHHKAVLTAEIVKELRERYAQGGTTHQALATEYKLNRVTVTNALCHNTWKHI